VAHRVPTALAPFLSHSLAPLFAPPVSALTLTSSTRALDMRSLLRLWRSYTDRVWGEACIESLNMRAAACVCFVLVLAGGIAYSVASASRSVPSRPTEPSPVGPLHEPTAALLPGGDTPGAMIRHVCATNSQLVNTFGTGLDTNILQPDRRAYHSIAQTTDPFSGR
jgi:hypothetical protein